MFKKIVLMLLVVVAGFLIFAATRPNTYRVQRSKQIAAPPEIIFDQLDDFRSWGAWSPWEKMDGQMKKSFSGPEQGKDSSYAWEGNDKVGTGKMTITDIEPPKSLAYRLEFIKPFAAVATSDFKIEPASEGSSDVTWTMTGNNNFVSKVFGVFFDMDKAIGADFERGLAELERVAEAEATKRSAAEKAAAEKVAAEAQAAAAAAEAQAQEAAAKAANVKSPPAARSR